LDLTDYHTGQQVDENKFEFILVEYVLVECETLRGRNNMNPSKLHFDDFDSCSLESTYAMIEFLLEMTVMGKYVESER
jgi:hypothetical protein